jgi:acyl-CoA thioesterase YciA
MKTGKPKTGKSKSSTPAKPAADPSAAAEEHVYPRDQIPSIRRVMMPRDTNAFGTIFGGVILSEIDLAAAVEAHRYHPGRLVTIALDGVIFRAPVHVGDLVSFFTETVRIGHTSIRVKIRVWAEGRFSGGATTFVTEAEATMVAVDERGAKVPILHPED